MKYLFALMMVLGVFVCVARLFPAIVLSVSALPLGLGFLVLGLWFASKIKL